MLEKEKKCLEQVRNYVDYFEDEHKNKFLQYCNNFITWLEQGEINQADENPHPRIFKNKQAFDLFDYLIEGVKSEKNKLAEVSFVFGTMKIKDNAIPFNRIFIEVL